MSGAALLSWVSQPDELDPSQNRAEKSFLRQMLYHLPQTIRPLLLTAHSLVPAPLPSLGPPLSSFRRKPESSVAT